MTPLGQRPQQRANLAVAETGQALGALGAALAEHPAYDGVAQGLTVICVLSCQSQGWLAINPTSINWPNATVQLFPGLMNHQDWPIPYIRPVHLTSSLPKSVSKWHASLELAKSSFHAQHLLLLWTTTHPWDCPSAKCTAFLQRLPWIKLKPIARHNNSLLRSFWLTHLGQPYHYIGKQGGVQGRRGPRQRRLLLQLQLLLGGLHRGRGRPRLRSFGAAPDAVATLCFLKKVAGGGTLLYVRQSLWLRAGRQGRCWGLCSSRIRRNPGCCRCW
eukprot:scaffold90086_cov21-Tisochrysis_lutea.AAC.3